MVNTKSMGFLTIMSLLSAISVVKWYWGKLMEIFPPFIETGAYRWTTTRWNPQPNAHLLNEGDGSAASFCCLLATHLKFDALHRHQLTLLADLELIAPGPVWNGLRPREVVPVLHHLRYHLVVCLGTEKSCDRQSVRLFNQKHDGPGPLQDS